MSRCKSCGAEIVWIKSAGGKWIPCDEGLVPYRESETGAESVVLDNGQVVRCTFKYAGQPTGMARIAHWATCPYADQHRRGRNAKV